MKITEFLQQLPLQEKPFAALIGVDTSYSLSPLMHNSAAKILGIDFEYFGLDVEENQIYLLKELLKHEKCKGFNITIPYKNKVLSLADELEPKVEELQACNTFFRKNGKWIASNTDIYGFVKPLISLPVDFSAFQAFIFGSGGASKAVFEGLTQLGVSSIYLVSRNTGFNKLSYQNWMEYISAEKKVFLINASPAGMTSLKHESPISIEQLRSIKPIICYDLVYNPIETTFLKISKDVGVKYCINGLEMLIQQGSKAFDLWNSVEFPVDKIREICLKELGSNHD